jgi:hypothetical protein
MKKGDIVYRKMRDFDLFGKIVEENPLKVQWFHPAFPEPSLTDSEGLRIHWSKKDQDEYHLQQLRNLLSKL